MKKAIIMGLVVLAITSMNAEADSRGEIAELRQIASKIHHSGAGIVKLTLAVEELNVTMKRIADILEDGKKDKKEKKEKEDKEKKEKESNEQ